MTSEHALALQSPRGVFSTRIPSTVTFAIALLLFVLPFAEFKCKLPSENQDAIIKIDTGKFSVSNTGLGLAFGSDWKLNIPGGNPFQNERSDEWKQHAKSQKPNYYAIVALAMAVLGLGLSFIDAAPFAVITTVAGGIGAGSLIGLMLDLHKKSSDIISGLQNAGNSLDASYQVDLGLRFTPWFYIAIIAMLVAGVFSYKRILSAGR